MRVGYGILLLGLISSLAHAVGVDTSGGGKAVVCRNADKTIKSVEILDLFEGRALYGLQIKSLGGTVEENLVQVHAKLNTIFSRFLVYDPAYSLISKAVNDFHLLPAGVVLVPVDDAAEVAIPSDCALEQLAYYQDDQILLVNQELWNALDTTNRAALFAHEAMYRQDRSLSHATNSRHARKVVAHLFSDYVFTPVMQGVPAVAQWCQTLLKDNPAGSSTFIYFLYPSPLDPSATIAQFVMVNWNLIFSKSAAEIFMGPGDMTVGLDLKSGFEPETYLDFERTYASGGKSYTDSILDSSGRHVMHCDPWPATSPADSTRLAVSPAMPIVITSDVIIHDPHGDISVHSPWFNAAFTIDTDKTITVTGFETTVTAPDGTVKVYKNTLSAKIEVAARGSHTFGPQYFSALPNPGSVGYSYDVSVVAQGWVGTKKHPAQRLNLQTQFKTQ